ncbi:thioredoxin fold domain-containing protein [Allochromatium humboldtianum]|uniref:Thioredoxin fold domain-containing protein n=1 Tax=Allochromatium humboldtianum TaxID=504901 RepID=A0A850RCM7_9GAMM|nr:thioredoxin fold domain-containing protein [Allochromatium humboldtianum]NVZ11078.1 thioredoxin fold domain-containing protein [Allochromatium humboldtianum]
MAWTIELSALARKNLISVLIVFSSAAPAFDRPDDLDPEGGTAMQRVSETAAYPDWFLSDRLDIRADLEAAIAAGKRGLMVYFGQEHCVHCERFMRVNLADPDLVAYLRRHFDLVSVDIHGRAEIRTLDGERLDEHTWARREQTDFTPSILFYDAEGRLALRLRGYYPIYPFRAALEYVADGHYQRESFDDYLARGDERLVFDSEDLNDQPFFSPPPHALDRRIPSTRPLAVFFERGDCHPCDVLHGRVLRLPETQRRFEALDAVQLDRRSDTPVITPKGERTTARAWADALEIRHAPAVLFFDEQGRELERLDSVLDFQRLDQVLDDILAQDERDQDRRSATSSHRP